MMRIHRIRIANVAGVSSREVTLANRGITLLAGPNESGKSTLFLALQALLDHPDDASHREVKALKPLHTGLTPEVEADLSIGPYRLTYSKSFAKGKAGGTTLRIHQPAAQSLTGREAHDRVAQIIDEHLDRALWDAMRITQGDALGLPTLAGVRSLSAALDQAVGNDIAGEREDTLLERANEEFRRYWTPGGKPSSAWLELDRKLAEAGDAERALREKLREMEADVTAYKSKTRELATATGQTGSLIAARDKAAADKVRVEGMLADVRIKELALTAANQAAQLAQNEVGRRAAEIHRLADADESARLAALEHAAAEERPAELARRVGAGEAKLKTAREALEAAAKALSLAEGDAVHAQNQMDLKLLTARNQSILKADRDAAEAAATAQSLRATQRDITALSQSSTAIAVAQAKLSSASPKVSINALAPVRVSVNGRVDELGAGQTMTAPAANAMQMRIGEIAEVLVEGANDARQLERELESAIRDHRAILERLGVTTIEEAEDQRQRRERALDQATAAQRAASEHLVDLTREALRDKIASLTEATQAYPRTRPAGAAPLPESPAAAQAIADDARRAFDRQRSAVDEIADELKSATAAAAAAQSAAAATKATWDSRVAIRDQAARALASARELKADALLQADLAAASAAAATALADRDRAQSAYRAADPELVAAGLTAAEKALVNHEQNLRRINDEVNRLKTRLEMTGEAGIEEGLQKAQRDVYVANDTVARFRRRAQAAKLLYETLQTCREEAQRSYVAPLKDEMERLGKLIFGEEFSVVIGKDLSVEARVMNGVAIPYAGLSSGAKEQIGILERLATARIVGKGGVPLLLDDAVAYTDNVRQETLAAALGFASVDTQTIIVTCTPEKYSHAPIETRIDF